jgi:hypothetical protein
VVTRKAVAAWLWIGLLLADAAAGAQPSPAETSAEARDARGEDAKRLFHEGVDLLAAMRWSEAEARFRQSVELVPRASSLYNWALALCALERYGECADAAQRVLEIADPHEHAEYREYAARLRERALASAAPPPPAPTESVAPEPAPVPVPEPVQAPAPRPAQPVEMHATAAAADRAEERGLSPGWFVIGGGALVLVGALVTGLLANAADDDFTEQCPGARDCDPSLMGLGERTERLALATDILLVTGAAAVGTGVTMLWLVDDGGDGPTPAARRPSGVVLTLRGRLP